MTFVYTNLARYFAGPRGLLNKSDPGVSGFHSPRLKEGKNGDSKMNPSFVREVRRQIRFTKKENRAIERMANNAGVNFSVYVRARCLSPASNDEAIKDPSRRSRKVQDQDNN